MLFENLLRGEGSLKRYALTMAVILSKAGRNFVEKLTIGIKIKSTTFSCNQNLKWTFNPPAASRHGGVCERCIRTVRKVIRAIMKEQLLDDEGLNTMCEVEAIVNGQPLTKLSDDPRDLEPLTPTHLLLLQSGSKVPPGVFTKEDCYENR